jgi:hypothetical protein
MPAKELCGTAGWTHRDLRFLWMNL